MYLDVDVDVYLYLLIFLYIEKLVVIKNTYKYI